jgi:hypothetical protein
MATKATTRRASAPEGGLDGEKLLELYRTMVAARATLLWTRNRKHYPMRDVEFY